MYYCRTQLTEISTRLAIHNCKKQLLLNDVRNPSLNRPFPHSNKALHRHLSLYVVASDAHWYIMFFCLHGIHDDAIVKRSVLHTENFQLSVRYIRHKNIIRCVTCWTIVPQLCTYVPYTKSYACNMHVTSTYMHVDPNMPVT